MSKLGGVYIWVDDEMKEEDAFLVPLRIEEATDWVCGEMDDLDAGVREAGYKVAASFEELEEAILHETLRRKDLTYEI